VSSALVAISLMMSGIVRLRIINLIGAFFFSMYGLIIGAYPVAVVNGFIVFVDIYYLWDIFKAKEFFRTLEVMHDSEYLHYFLDFHKSEILKYIPGFNYQPGEHSMVFFVLRNSVPAGLILAEKYDDESIFIELDFVIPGYRDLKIGKYVYKNIFTSKHLQRIYTHPGNAKHDGYLGKMGFEKTELNGQPVFCLRNDA
ncbi:MAG: hypothetical protein LWX56_10970, partial [Ignavibacteria bacterium]|nr:hypothetical protein [Ignavibacteria bacterium]